jgi:nucleoside phosphorylase
VSTLDGGSVEGGRLGRARVVVLTIIDEELDAVAHALAAEQELVGPGSSYLTPNAEAPHVAVIQAPDRAGIPAEGVARDIIEDLRPELLVVTGIAGGIRAEQRDEVRHGDVVVADYLHYCEFVKLVEGEPRALKRHFAYDQPSVSARAAFVNPARRRPDWRKKISVETPPNEPEAALEPKVIVGAVVAGDKIMGSPTHGWQRHVVETFNDAIAVDMESVGVARGIHELRRSVTYNPRFLVIRGISDYVTVESGDTEDDQGDSGALGVASNEAKQQGPAEKDGYFNSAERTKWKQYAAATAAAFTVEVVGRMLRFPDERGRLG